MSKATINREQLERMMREELIVLVESLYQVIGQLQEWIIVLEAGLAKLKKPPATSSITLREVRCAMMSFALFHED